MPSLWRKFVDLHVSPRFLNQVFFLFGAEILKLYPTFEQEFGPLHRLQAGISCLDVFNDLTPQYQKPIHRLARFKPKSNRYSRVRQLFGVYTILRWSSIAL